MIPREKAVEFVLALRACEGTLTRQDLPEWIAAMRERLRKAEDRCRKGKHTASLHEIGAVAAIAIAALEQHGEDIRDSDPSLS